MRTPFMAANWKMNKTVSEALDMATELKDLVNEVDDVDIAIFSPATNLYSLKNLLKETNIAIGGQNMYYKDSGAFTAELSPAMLKSVGCEYVIVGHSERREIFGEDDKLLNLKLKKAFAEDITPILCIGEKLAEREDGNHFARVKFQLEAGLSGVEASNVKDMVLAYEPLWAIGTGETATPEQAEEIIAFIREEVARMYDQDIADSVRIQYGGSVKPWNVKEIMAQPNIDGALVGGASLEAESFSKIIKFQD